MGAFGAFYIAVSWPRESTNSAVLYIHVLSRLQQTWKKSRISYVFWIITNKCGAFMGAMSKPPPQVVCNVCYFTFYISSVALIFTSTFLSLLRFPHHVNGTEWPRMCWCAIRKLLTQTHARTDFTRWGNICDTIGGGRSDRQTDRWTVPSRKAATFVLRWGLITSDPDISPRHVPPDISFSRTIPPPVLHGLWRSRLPPPLSANLQHKTIYRYR